MKVEGTIHFGKQGKSKQARKSKQQVVGRTPRIVKLIALAIRFEGLIAVWAVPRLRSFFGSRTTYAAE